MKNAYDEWVTLGDPNPPVPDAIRKDPSYTVLGRVKPPTFNNHYSNPDSQNALIAQTADFPGFFKDSEYDHHVAYSDRLQGWDSKNYRLLTDFIGTGDQNWTVMSAWSDNRLQQMAQIAFKLDELPTHVRVIHAFNVSNGYSCPVIVALSAKNQLEAQN